MCVCVCVCVPASVSISSNVKQIWQLVEVFKNFPVLSWAQDKTLLPSVALGLPLANAVWVEVISGEEL